VEQVVDLRAKLLVAQKKMIAFELVLVAHCHYRSCLPLESVGEESALLMKKSGTIMERVEVEVASFLALALLEVGLIAEVGSIAEGGSWSIDLAGLWSIDLAEAEADLAAVVDLVLAGQVVVFRAVDQAVVDLVVEVDRVSEVDLAVGVDLVALVHLVRLHLEELGRQL
jgi:hypothetical protein